MKVPQSEKNKLIKEMIEHLAKVEETSKVSFTVSGRDLLNSGMKRDSKGRLIVAHSSYPIVSEKKVPINHKRRISNIIKSSPTKEMLIEELRKYKAKYSKDNFSQ